MSSRRRLLGLGLASGAGTLLPWSAACAAESWKEVIVDAAYRGKNGEVVDGKPTFTTIQAALDAAPGWSAPYRLLIRAGHYREKLTITRDNLQFVGEGRDKTIISFDAYAGQIGEGYSSTWTTFGCATIILKAKDFSARNLTIENAFDYFGNDARQAGDQARVTETQAVALMLADRADRCAFFNVNITGYQDTLFTNAGRSYFRDSLISGVVDFIFGAGTAVFDQCEIQTRARNKPNLNPPHGFLTAPSTNIRNDFGLVFLRCKLTRENDKVPPQSSPLGRPWHPNADTNAVGQAVFVECFMDAHIASEGWAPMGASRGGSRIMFQPEDARFFEYRSTGPGAVVNEKRRQLSDAQAAGYTLAKMLDDWAPE